MIKCEKCCNEISFKSKLKSLTKIHGDIQCIHCKAIYRPVMNLYRRIYTGMIAVLSGMLILEAGNSIKGFVLCFIILICVFMSDLIPMRWQKYKLYKTK